MKKIILTFLILLIVGCGSKKKVIEEESAKTEITTEVEKSTVETEVKTEKETAVVKVDSTAEKETTEIFKEVDENFEVEADSTGVVTVETIKTDTGTKKVWTGVKSFKTGKTTTNERKSLKERITMLKNDSTSRVKTDSLNSIAWESEKATLIDEYEKRLKDKTEKVGGWFWWFIASLGLNLILVLYINRKRIRRVLTRGSPI